MNTLSFESMIVSMVWSISSKGAAPLDSPCIFFTAVVVLLDVPLSRLFSRAAFVLLLMRRTVSTTASGYGGKRKPVDVGGGKNGGGGEVDLTDRVLWVA